MNGPYTMTTVFGDAGSHRLDFNGELVRYYTTWEGDIEFSPNGLADLLNDAYQKGVETGRRNRDDSWDQVDIPDISDVRLRFVALLVATYGFDNQIAERLVNEGICSPAAFEGVEARDLVNMGFSQEEADAIMAKVNP
jgi:hypothetical protein